MTLKQTIRKIKALHHLIGQKVPQWNSPVVDIIPAPVTEKFQKFIDVYSKTASLKAALELIKSNKYDILLLFNKPNLHSSLVYEWYSYFY